MQVLDSGMRNTDNGGFLQYSESVRYDAAQKIWSIKNAPVNAEQFYRVAFSDYLLTGNEKRLAFLTPANPAIKVYNETTPKNDPRLDICLAVIHYLKKIKPN